MTEKIKRFPPPVLRRLTQYLVHVRKVQAEGRHWISSQDIADALGLTSSTVRPDLSHLAFSGISKKGYEAGKLESVLQEALGVHETQNMVIVGAGNLGRALAQHGEFERQGFIIRAVFDSDPRLTGKKVGKLAVQGMDGLPAVVRKERIEIGMIAVPASSAQDVADRLVKAGISGLLNLSPAHVRVPEHVSVVQTRIAASLQELSYLIRAKASSPRS